MQRFNRRERRKRGENKDFVFWDNEFVGSLILSPTKEAWTCFVIE